MVGLILKISRGGLGLGLLQQMNTYTDGNGNVMSGNRLNGDRNATLGCGTLILIALIVVIFGNAGDEEIKDDALHVGRTHRHERQVAAGRRRSCFR